ncbi:MAG: hypothetical protein WA821_03255 [Anaerolineales bacterium]
MANTQNTRIQPQVLKADEDALLAVKAMGDYKPANPAYSLEALTNLHNEMQAAQEEELNVQNALAAARDKTVSKQWAYHNAVLGLKDQVVAQYGSSSDQVASMGLKKKSERKAPVRKAKAA